MGPWSLYANLLVLAACYNGSIVYGDVVPYAISEELFAIL
jgi:hypothetical protein